MNTPSTTTSPHLTPVPEQRDNVGRWVAILGGCSFCDQPRVMNGRSDDTHCEDCLRKANRGQLPALAGAAPTPSVQPPITLGSTSKVALGRSSKAKRNSGVLTGLQAKGSNTVGPSRPPQSGPGRQAFSFTIKGDSKKAEEGKVSAESLPAAASSASTPNAYRPAGKTSAPDQLQIDNQRAASGFKKVEVGNQPAVKRALRAEGVKRKADDVIVIDDDVEQPARKKRGSKATERSISGRSAPVPVPTGSIPKTSTMTAVQGYGGSYGYQGGLSSYGDPNPANPLNSNSQIGTGYYRGQTYGWSGYVDRRDATKGSYVDNMASEIAAAPTSAIPAPNPSAPSNMAMLPPATTRRSTTSSGLETQQFSRGSAAHALARIRGVPETGSNKVFITTPTARPETTAATSQTPVPHLNAPPFRKVEAPQSRTTQAGSTQARFSGASNITLNLSSQLRAEGDGPSVGPSLTSPCVVFPNNGLSETGVIPQNPGARPFLSPTEDGGVSPADLDEWISQHQDFLRALGVVGPATPDDDTMAEVEQAKAEQAKREKEARREEAAKRWKEFRRQAEARREEEARERDWEALGGNLFFDLDASL